MQLPSSDAAIWNKTASPAGCDCGAQGTPQMPGRLLIAEDARCVQQNLLSILGKMHVTPDMVENGRMACDKVEESKAEGKPYDLILMDMQMPRMNGYQAVEWLREQGWKGPIVAISAFDGEKDHEKILKAGCDACVSKPVNEAKLREIFTKHLGANVRPATADEQDPGKDAPHADCRRTASGANRSSLSR
jgi:CheY-like chemotaxis protein